MFEALSIVQRAQTVMLVKYLERGGEHTPLCRNRENCVRLVEAVAVGFEDLVQTQLELLHLSQTVVR
jgi:hypothetical protein